MGRIVPGSRAGDAAIDLDAELIDLDTLAAALSMNPTAYQDPSV
jgi:hypothetical protein